MLIKSLLLDSPKLSITIGRLVTGILPLWRSLAPEHSWASTGGPGRHGASTSTQEDGAEQSGGGAGTGGWTARPEKHPPLLPRGELPRPHSTFISFHRELWSGPLPDVDAVRVRLLFVQIYAHNHSSCAFQLCIFFNVKKYSRLDLVKPENTTNQVLESDWMLTCYRLIKNWNVTLSQS